MKRSHEPVFWSLFGAGGMLSALVGAALVFVTGIGVPLALLLSPELMGYQNMLAFAQHWFGKLVIAAVIILFLWHAALRIMHLLHDFGVHARGGARIVGFGFTVICTLVTIYLLLALGF